MRLLNNIYFLLQKNKAATNYSPVSFKGINLIAIHDFTYIKYLIFSQQFFEFKSLPHGNNKKERPAAWN